MSRLLLFLTIDERIENKLITLMFKTNLCNHRGTTGEFKFCSTKFKMYNYSFYLVMHFIIFKSSSVTTLKLLLTVAPPSASNFPSSILSCV